MNSGTIVVVNPSEWGERDYGGREVNKGGEERDYGGREGEGWGERDYGGREVNKGGEEEEG